MRRRAFLASAAVAAAGAAGCTGLLGDDEDESSPADPVEGFYRAANRGDHEAANENVHPDSPLDPLTAPEAADLGDLEIEVESTEVSERSDDEAVVEVVVRYDDPEAEEPETASTTFEVRHHEGEWLLWDETGSAEASATPPQVQWDVEEVRADGAVSAVEFTHDGGHAVEVVQLSVRVGLSATGGSGGAEEIRVGDTLTVNFDDDGEPVPAGTTVEVLWTGGGPGTTTIGSHTLSSETTGPLSVGFEV